MEKNLPHASHAKPALRTDAVYDPTKPFNLQVRALISKTHPEEGPIVVKSFGKRFVVERDATYWNGRTEITGTDGIGTKGAIHWMMGTMASGAQDAFAMVMDDLIESGHVPVIMQDHILMQSENEERILQIVGALSNLAISNPWVCETVPNAKYPIIISGGETAIINTLQGLEVGITGTGYVKRSEEITKSAKEGDLIIGIESSGAHSNGYSFFRKVFLEERGMSLDSKLWWGRTLGEELTIPTRVYLPAIKALIRRAKEEHGTPSSVIHGMVHITGGGLSKLSELIPDTKPLEIWVNRKHELKSHPIFAYAMQAGNMNSIELYTRFNMGIGYAIAVDNEFYGSALSTLRQYFPSDVIGEVKARNGDVCIDSEFDIDSTVIFPRKAKPYLLADHNIPF